jgi:hypothetical protein
MRTAAMACPTCGVKVEGAFSQTFFNALPVDDQGFLEQYLLAGFSIKALEQSGPLGYDGRPEESGSGSVASRPNQCC